MLVGALCWGGIDVLRVRHGSLGGMLDKLHFGCEGSVGYELTGHWPHFFISHCYEDYARSVLSAPACVTYIQEIMTFLMERVAWSYNSCTYVQHPA